VKSQESLSSMNGSKKVARCGR